MATPAPKTGQDAANSSTSATNTETLPPLSDHEFRAYNNLADRMELFHNGFRQTWNLLWQACTTNRRPQGYTLKQLLSAGLEFAQHLTMHHRIEETYFFPKLASRMPEFDPKKGSLVKQHEQIHKGLVDFEEYLRSCRDGERDFEMSALKDKMESWGTVLWEHLDDEVRMLGAENLRKYWTLQEIRRFQM